MCKVFSTKAAQAFKACTLYAYKITKKELYYTYFEVFFYFILRIIHYLFFVCTISCLYYWLCISLISRVLREIRVQFACFFRYRENYSVSLLVGG